MTDYKEIATPSRTKEILKKHGFSFKKIYGTNDQLKFTLHEERRLLMIEEGDEDAQNNIEDP